jgi:hypothetical protein
MSNKMRMFLGIGFVFVQFVVVSLFSIYYAYNISKQTSTLFVDNIRTLQYCEKMSEAADAMNNFHVSRLTGIHSTDVDIDKTKALFDENLANEEKNITESGERELVSALKEHYQRYQDYIISGRNARTDLSMYVSKIMPLYNAVKHDLHSIAEVNHQSITRKKEQASVYENHFYVILSIIATICILVSFSFLFNYPRTVKEVEEKKERL